MPVNLTNEVPRGINYPNAMPTLYEENGQVFQPPKRGKAAWQERKAAEERAASVARVVAREQGLPRGLRGRASRTPSPASSLGSISEE